MKKNIFEDMLNEIEDKSFFKSFRVYKTIFIIVLIIVSAYFVYDVFVSAMSPQEVKKSIKIVSTESRWVDKDITPFQISIVPAIWIKIKNTGKRPLEHVQFEGRFEFTENGKLHSNGSAVAFQKPLPVGGVSEKILIRSEYGYKASSKEAFLENAKEWRAMQVKIFARTKGSSLVPIGDVYPIEKKIAGINKTYSVGDKEKINARNLRTKKTGESIQIIKQNSLWIDKRPGAGKKSLVIVPQIEFTVKNIGKEIYKNLIFKGVFLFEKTEEILGEGINLTMSSDFKPLDESENIVLKSDLGYSATSKKAFFDNIVNWKGVKVQVFVKSYNTDYALLGIFPIKKKIEGVKVIYKNN